MGLSAHSPESPPRLPNNWGVMEAAFQGRPELVRGLIPIPDELIQRCFANHDDPRLMALLEAVPNNNIILSLKGSEVFGVCDYLAGKSAQFPPGTGELDIGLMPLNGPRDVYDLLNRANIDLTAPDVFVNPPRTNPLLELVRLLKDGQITAEFYLHYARMGSVTGNIFTEAQQSPLTALSMRVLITPWGSSFLFDPFGAMDHWVRTDQPEARIPNSACWPKSVTLAIPYGAAAIARRDADPTGVLDFWRQKVEEFDLTHLTPQSRQAVADHRLKLSRSLRANRGDQAVLRFEEILAQIGFTAFVL